ncbi:MAG: alpha-amylase [Candidatus Azobacteroides sp.]|nr:alpha-amylase [Candidatus Azobacteroides sp.]
MRNGVMMQYFEWNLPDNGKFWKQLKEDAVHLQEIGVTSVWIPPACKASAGIKDTGYGIYDLYDLGEFNQKNTIRTKYGTKNELIEAIDELHKYQISVYFDAVMNHKAGADYTEKFLVKEVDPNNREHPISDAYEIEGWTGFDFKGRGNKYSDFKWHWYHFSGTDYNQANNKTAIYQIQGEGKKWAEGVDGENGNYDYLMFADIDFDNPDVVTEMKKWGQWVAKELKLDGMRLDAIKHINDSYIEHFLDAVRAEKGNEFYAVGEYWKRDINELNAYLSSVKYKVDLFDVPLHYNMYQASEQGESYDMRNLLKDTLVAVHPEVAVTFVDNHDSQWGSSLQSQVKSWFKPLAYALITLMEKGYPCIFYGDYYSMGDKKSPHRLIIDILLAARKKYAYGQQVDYFDHPSTVGFVRMGDELLPGSGLAFLMTNGKKGNKIMNLGTKRKGEVWYEFTGNIHEEVTIDENGNGNFSVEGGNIAVWVKKEDKKN